METVEERVAYVSGRVAEHGRMVDNVSAAVVHLETRMERRFEAVDRRFEAIDRRFEAVDHRFDALEQKMSRQFLWLVGLLVTTLAAIVTTFASTMRAM
jgi:uncharacterized coiled-coil protein SlyX